MGKSTKRKDGSLVKTITDPKTGKRKYFYGKTEREINKKILEYNRDSEKGKSFKKIADEWWEQSERYWAHQTIKVYKPAFARALEAFGETSIKEITAKKISNFFQRMAKQDFAQRTVMNQRTVLNQIFNHAVVEGEIQYNPCSAVQTPRNLKKTKRQAASKEDELKIIAAKESWSFPYIALMTGMRKGEILALQWKDIDFEKNIIYVTKSVGHNGDRPYIKEPKTEAGCRIVPLLNDLKEYLLKQPNKDPDHYIVSDDGTSPLTNRRYQTLSSKFKQQTETTCTAHRLRHSFATNAYEKQVDVKGIQELVGHKHLSTTLNIYTHFREQSVKSAAEKLNNKSNQN